MFDSVNNSLSSLNNESINVIVAATGAIILATLAGLRGMRKGTPTPGAVSEAARQITQMSCGAPELAIFLREMRVEHQSALRRQQDIMHDIETIKVSVAVIEDRTRRS